MGYSNIVYKTRDMDSDRNPNCGGGVGFFVNKDLEFDVLEEESIFVAGVYESLWIKVNLSKNHSKIIGNIYRPNTAPRANFKQAVEIHSSIISSIGKNTKYSKIRNYAPPFDEKRSIFTEKVFPVFSERVFWACFGIVI